MTYRYGQCIFPDSVFVPSAADVAGNPAAEKARAARFAMPAIPITPPRSHVAIPAVVEPRRLHRRKP